MTDVRIPVSADASGAVSAFNQIREAIQRAGQEGRTFSELDLDHPELKELAEDLQRLNSQFQTFRRLPHSRDLRAGLRATGQEGQAPWSIDWHSMFPDQAAQQRQMARAAGYATAGTRWESTAGAAGPPPAAQTWRQSLHEHARSRRHARQEQRGLIGDLFDSIPGSPLLKGALGLAGMGGAMALVGRGVGDATSEYTELTDLRRRLGEVAEDFQQFRGRITAAGEGLGVTRLETLRLTEAFAHASGEVQQLPERVEDAIGFARGMGLDPNQVAPWLGRASFLGVSGERGSMSDRELMLLLGETISRGGMYGKADEVMASLERYVGQVQQVTLRAPDLDEFARLRTTMYQSDVPGLRGGGGDRLIATIENAIRNANGGDARGWTFARALDMPGMTLAMQQYLREGSMFDRPQETFNDPRLSGKSTVELIMDEMNRMYGGFDDPFMRLLGMSSTLGISMRQAEAWEEVFAQFREQGQDASPLTGLMRAAGIDERTLDVTGINDLARISTADRETLKALRDRYLQAHGADAMGSVEAAMASGDTEQLRIELAKVAAEFGMTKDEGAKTREAMTDLRDELAKLGAELIPVLDKLKEGVTVLADGVTRLLGFLGIEQQPPSLLSPEQQQQLDEQAQDAWGTTFRLDFPDQPIIKARPRPNEGAGASADALSEQARTGAAEVIEQGDIRLPEPDVLTGQARDAALARSAARSIEMQSVVETAMLELPQPGDRSNLDTPEFRAQLAEADQRYGLPIGTLWSVMMQETGGRNLGYHYPTGSDGRRRTRGGTVSSAFGPFGILMDSTAKDPGFGTDPLQDTSLAEQIRFAGQYLSGRARSGGSLRAGLAGYGEGSRYANQVLNRIPRFPEPEPDAIAITEAARSPGAWQRLPSAPGAQAEVPQLRLPDEGASLGAGKIQHELAMHIVMQDRQGRPLGEARHRMGLSAPSATGTLSMEALYGEGS